MLSKQTKTSAEERLMGRTLAEKVWDEHVVRTRRR